MKAMLFAAGLGTRLKPFTDSNPKALALVNNRTLLEHNIRYLQRYGIFDVVINVHHFAEKIEATLFENDNFGSRITISDERQEILETGGGLKKAAPYFDGEQSIVVMNVDALTNLAMDKMIAYHDTRNSMATLAVMQRASGRHLLFDRDMTLCGWQNNSTGELRISKNTMPVFPYAFSGIQVISKKVLQNIPFIGKFSLIDLYLHLAKENILKGYDHTGDIFIDVGKPESLAQAATLFP